MDLKKHLGSPDSWSDCIRRQWEQNLHVGGRTALLELRPGLHQILCSAPTVLLHFALDPDQGLHILAETVRPVMEKFSQSTLVRGSLSHMPSWSCITLSVMEDEVEV